mgnify:CR=1 FL=1
MLQEFAARRELGLAGCSGREVKEQREIVGIVRWGLQAAAGCEFGQVERCETEIR